MNRVLKAGNEIATGAMAALLILAVLFLLWAADHGHAARSGQESFDSPEEAMARMSAAVASGDGGQLAAIFGPRSGNIFPADEAENARARERFAKAYEEKNRLESLGPGRIVLHLGNKDWPWPIPLVKKGKRWMFDTEAGIKEIIARRIGKNEVAAVQVSLAYVDAQFEYAREYRPQGLAEYARTLLSDPGKKNGLCWEAANGEEPSPLGPLAANACKTEMRGRPGQEPQPYHGYFYKILKSQGEHAPGGAYDYVVDGRMLGGFALVAYPAEYGVTGITTFIVNQQGVVYQKDLGRDTEKTAEAMVSFDPDPTWAAVD